MSSLPFQFLSDEAFARLRSMLVELSFTERGVCNHTGVESLYDFTMRRHARAGATPVERPLDVMVRLFMDSEAVKTDVVNTLLDAEQLTLLREFGLVHDHPTRPDSLIAPVLLYPTEGPWLVSDRSVSIEDEQQRPSTSMRDDAVYLALTTSVRVFLSTLPRDPVPAYLELCSGTGIAALIGAASGAGHAYAVDITERSTEFARFNARLNGLRHVTALQGDLYEPVAGRTFDTIVAHPPYVPSLSREMIYRDGGEDGEHITRAVLEGAREHLAPNGVLQCTALLTARAGQPAAQRARAMLGADSESFDMVYLRNGSADLLKHLRGRLTSSDAALAQGAIDQLKRFAELKVESMEMCTIIVRRHAEERLGINIAVERSGATSWEHVKWMLAIGAAASDGERFAAQLLDSKVCLSPRARLEVSYAVGSEASDPWVASGGRISVDAPFVSGIDVGMGDATMLARFDGTHTLRSALQSMQQEGVLPADADAMDFARSFGQLVLDGIVGTDAFPLPTTV